MGVDRLLGIELLQRIDEVFSRNQITVLLARDEIQGIDNEVLQLYKVLEDVIGGLDYLRILPDVLGAGEYEVVVTIPRPFVRNSLGGLTDEFSAVQRLLGPLVELATGSRPDLEVRAIASSDFTLILQAAPAVAKLVAVATAEILRAYRKVAEIRKIQEQQQKAEFPPEMLLQTEALATTQMNTAMDALADKLLGENGANLSGQGRRYEVEMELKQSLNGAAYQIDSGVRIRVRGEPPANQSVAGAEGEPAEISQEMQDHLTTMEAAKELEATEFEGVPILSLPPEPPPPSADNE